MVARAPHPPPFFLSFQVGWTSTVGCCCHRGSSSSNYICSNKVQKRRLQLHRRASERRTAAAAASSICDERGCCCRLWRHRRRRFSTHLFIEAIAASTVVLIQQHVCRLFRRSRGRVVRVQRVLRLRQAERQVGRSQFPLHPRTRSPKLPDHVLELGQHLQDAEGATRNGIRVPKEE